MIVATIKALKYNASIQKEDILKENVNAVEVGLANLEVHIENMLKYTKNVIVTINRYDTDTEEEIKLVSDFVKEKGLLFSINDSYRYGGEGAVALAKKVVEVCNHENDFKILYADNLNIEEKIETICHEIYHASHLEYEDIVKEKIREFEKLGYGHYPICIAKTQYSISDDPKKLGYPKGYSLHVKDVNIYTGAEFIVVYLGDIMTMPGLSRHANYENIDMDLEHQIRGLF